MKRTPQILEAHFRRRLQQRFGFEITAEEVGQLIERIESGRAVRLIGSFAKRSLHAVFMGKRTVMVPVVYSASPRALVTALPQRALLRYRRKIVAQLAGPLAVRAESVEGDAPLLRLEQDGRMPCYRVRAEAPFCSFVTYVFYRETLGERKLLYVQSNAHIACGEELKRLLISQYQLKYSRWPKSVAEGLAKRFYRALMEAIAQLGLPWHEAGLSSGAPAALAA